MNSIGLTFQGQYILTWRDCKRNFRCPSIQHCPIQNGPFNGPFSSKKKLKIIITVNSFIVNCKPLYIFLTCVLASSRLSTLYRSGQIDWMRGVRGKHFISIKLLVLSSSFIPDLDIYYVQIDRYIGWIVIDKQMFPVRTV